MSDGPRRFKFRPVRSTATAVSALLAVSAALALAGAYSNWLENDLIRTALVEGGVSEEQIAANDERQQVIALATLVVLLVTGIGWLCWVQSAAKNAWELGAGAMTCTPGWAVGWYFVPIANLFKPLSVMKEIWRASNPDDDSPLPAAVVSPLLDVWWCAWVLSNIAARFVAGAFARATTPDQVIGLNKVSIGLQLLEPFVALLAGMVIWRTVTMQEQRAYLLATSTHNPDVTRSEDPLRFFGPQSVSPQPIRISGSQ